MAEENFSIIVVGGGAAGFFAAITCAEHNPNARIVILEKGKKVLQKVKISGGGRCNLTHACFDPGELIQYYPRGGKELLGPFHRFAPGDTLDWFEKRGVETKIESDGRIFPVSNDSQTVIDCLVNQAKSLGIEILTQQNVSGILVPHPAHSQWQISTDQGRHFQAERIMIATGSNPKIWEILSKLGHQIIPPVPSLFTFNIDDPRIAGLEGISLSAATVHIPSIDLQAEGPLLVTHWGMSGPAVLKLSAWGARELAAQDYQTDISVNWSGSVTFDKIETELRALKQSHGKKQIRNLRPSSVPQRLWSRLLVAAGISLDSRWADLNKVQLQALRDQLSNANFKVTGKSTFKEEFVTSGGVDLREIDFRKFESTIVSGLYLAGEVLDIDAITGGFNFQAAWTGGYLAGKAMANN